MTLSPFVSQSVRNKNLSRAHTHASAITKRRVVLGCFIYKRKSLFKKSERETTI